MNDISMNIRALRKKRGLSQDALAARLNVTRQTISNWETGRSFPDLDTVVRLSEILETTPTQLLYPAPEKKRLRTVSAKWVLGVMAAFFLAMTLGGGLMAMLFQGLVGGGVEQSFLYPLYGGVILLAGLVVVCTCVVLEEIRNLPLNWEEEKEE